MAKIKRLGVLKTAVFLGIFLAFTGLIFGLLSAVATSFVSLPSGTPGYVLTLTGYLGILIWAVGLGIFGFVYGLIFTLIINLGLKIIKGLNLEIDMNDEPQPTSTKTQPIQAAAPVKKVSIPQI